LTISFNSSAQTREHIIKVNKELHEIFIDSVSGWPDLIQKAQIQNKFIYIYCTELEEGVEIPVNVTTPFRSKLTTPIRSKLTT
jgi:hypothetical protein